MTTGAVPRGLRGGCACGAIRYLIDATAGPVVFCHCEPCRRTTGHHTAASSVDPDDLTFVDHDGRARGEPDELRWWARTDEVEYGFCRTCGSSLFWRTAARPEQLAVSAGTVDQPSGLRATTALFVGEHGDYFERTPLPTEYEADFPPDVAAH